MSFVSRNLMKIVLSGVLMMPSMASVMFAQTQGPGGQLNCPPQSICITPNPTPTPRPTPSPTPTPTPMSGFIEPKFIVVAVTYAPPGSASTVSYTNTTMMGTSVSVSDSFSTQTTETVTQGSKTSSLFGILPSIGFTNTSSTSFTQEQDTSESIAVNQTTTNGFIIRGPASSAVGLNHDEDVIWVWLNPVLYFTMTSPSNIQWVSFGFDDRDPTNDMDVFGIHVKYLNGHATIPNDIAAVLARSWAPAPADGSGPGLTSADLAKILAADPFSNPSYVVNMLPGHQCTLDMRFCLTSNQNLQYSPPPPGGQPITQTLSLQHQTTQTEGQGASFTFQEGFSTDLNVSGGFLSDFTLDLKNSVQLTLMTKFNVNSTQQVGQTISASVTGPASTDNYTGPVEFNIFQDNVYGTFMFGFVPPPTFSLSTAPGAQTVIAGSNCASYTLTVSAVAGQTLTGSESLSVSGLPSGGTASFSPASISGAGSSIMQVCEASSTPLGTSTLTIAAVNGIEVHDAQVTFTVSPPPDFTLSGSPSSASIVVGDSASYTISTTSLNGFGGSVSLTLGGLPAGTTASFSPGSISGSGSSTLTVATTSSTPVGTYTLIVTGASGSLQHSTTVTLSINSVPPPPPPPPSPCMTRRPSSSTTNKAIACPQ